MVDYPGHCPLCSGKLFVSIVSPGRLICSNGDYEVMRVDFERAWDEYDNARKQAVDWQPVEQLLEDLKGKNLKR